MSEKTEIVELTTAQVIKSILDSMEQITASSNELRRMLSAIVGLDHVKGMTTSELLEEGDLLFDDFSRRIIENSIKSKDGDDEK